MGTRHAVIVTGDREWRDARAMGKALDALPVGTVVITGRAPGADTVCEQTAEGRPLVLILIPYFGWLGKAGGPARNTFMKKLLLMFRDVGYTIEVLAFHDHLELSKGTKNMVTQARKAKIRVKHYKHKTA